MLAAAFKLGFGPTDESHAAPLLNSRAGGIALVGPSVAHPASFSYNPSALTLLPPRVFGLYVNGAVQIRHGSIHRQAIDSTTGRAGGAADMNFAGESFFDPFPQGYLSIYSTLGSESFVLGVAFYNPGGEKLSLLRGPGGDFFDPATQGGSRYHGVELGSLLLQGTVGLAYRIIHRKLSVGVAMSYLRGEMNYAFVRDTAFDGGSNRGANEVIALDDCGGGQPCNYNADSAGEGIRINGGGNGLSVAFGMLGHPHANLDIGVGFVSRVIGLVAEGDAWVTRSEAQNNNAIAAQLTIPEIPRQLQGRGSVAYSLPDQIYAGITWRAHPALSLNFQFRWLTYSLHDSLTIRLNGSDFRDEPQIPSRIVHNRGFRDVFGFQLGFAYAVTSRIELQFATMLETAALGREAVSAIAIDAIKFDGLVALRWQLNDTLVLYGGYNLVAMLNSQVDNSSFDPSLMVACVDQRYDVDTSPCQLALNGKGLATTDGNYALMTHRIGVGLNAAW
jgi:long-subunit fatty acid transport protein